MTELKSQDAGPLMEVLQSLAGYLGAAALFIGGIAMYVNLPVIGQVTCMYCPTPNGVFYIILAVVSAYIVWLRRIKLLYITGGIACLLVAWDLYSATSIGYLIQMIFGSGLSPTMGGQMDPKITGMMQNAGFAIPTAWIVLAGGAFLLIFAPQFEKGGQAQPAPSPREQNLNERVQELDKIIRMYRDGDISKQEFSHLKEEIMRNK